MVSVQIVGMIILVDILLRDGNAFYALDLHFCTYGHVLVESLWHAFNMLGLHIMGMIKLIEILLRVVCDVFP